MLRLFTSTPSIEFQSSFLFYAYKILNCELRSRTQFTSELRIMNCELCSKIWMPILGRFILPLCKLLLSCNRRLSRSLGLPWMGTVTSWSQWPTTKVDSACYADYTKLVTSKIPLRTRSMIVVLSCGIPDGITGNFWWDYRDFTQSTDVTEGFTICQGPMCFKI